MPEIYICDKCGESSNSDSNYDPFFNAAWLKHWVKATVVGFPTAPDMIFCADCFRRFYMRGQSTTKQLNAWKKEKEMAEKENV
jgi:DNA-directed RNA polymerase subunit RPC12/RpoP